MDPIHGTDALFATPPTLPLEIIEAIIDELASETSSLRHCSVLSKAWRNRSQHYIFRVVTLDKQSALDTLVTVLLANPTLANHIQHVQIVAHLLRLPTRLPPMCNADSLCISTLHPDCGEILDGYIAWLVATFPNITRLELTESSLCSNHDMPLRLCLAFSRLQHLLLDGNHTDFVCNMPPSAQSSGTCELKTLAVFREPSVTLDVLGDPHRILFGALETFIYSHQHLAAFNAFGTFIKRATSLRHICLLTSSVMKTSLLIQYIAAHLDFATHRSLGALTITCNGNFREHPASLVPFVRAISAIRSRPPVDFTVSNSSGTQPEAWRRFSRTLARMLPSDSEAAELILNLHGRNFRISSLSMLENVLPAALMT